MGLMEHLPELLARADIVVSVLPGTPATTHLYDAKLFGAMKQGAYFINVGRGSAVVQKDLRAALESGHLAGAAVDVTEVEPLPQDDPLWHTPNMYITPHIAGDFHLQAPRTTLCTLKQQICGATWLASSPEHRGPENRLQEVSNGKCGGDLPEGGKEGM